MSNDKRYVKITVSVIGIILYFLKIQTIWRIRRDGYKRVALQMPEGLTMFATTISDIIEKVRFLII